MGWILGLVTKNPLVLAYIAAGAFAAGLLTGGGTAWKVQGWRIEALQTKYDAFVSQVKLLGEQAEKDKKRIEADHAKTTQEIKNAIPKKIAAARTGAVAAYRLRYPGGGAVSCPAVDTSGVPATVKEPVVAGWAGAADPTFIEVCAEDAQIRAMVGDWARGIGFPVK